MRALACGGIIVRAERDLAGAAPVICWSTESMEAFNLEVVYILLFKSIKRARYARPRSAVPRWAPGFRPPMVGVQGIESDNSHYIPH